MKRLCLFALVALFALPAVAADHNDGPAAKADPGADITDFFMWMSPDGQRVNLVMNFFPFATTAARLPTNVAYVFHTHSAASATATSSTAEDVICQFDADQKVSCWAGDSFVTGDASNTQGITSSDGKMRVFAGLRDDPFFFNLAGFEETAKAVAAAAPGLQTDPAGCPTIDTTTQQTLVAQLAHGPNGAAPKDDFAGKNVLSLVVSIDKSVLTKGGPLVAAYAATHRR